MSGPNNKFYHPGACRLVDAYFRLNLACYRRYFGIVISHYQVALYSARRDEMVETVQATLFYMNPDAPFPVHSPYSALPYERVLYEDMPTKFFFDLLQETDQEFVDRTGWFYRHDQPLYVPNPCVLVQPPHLPEGSHPYSPAAPSVFPAPLPSPNQH